jgi:hypothetical protein
LRKPDADPVRTQCEAELHAGEDEDAQVAHCWPEF